MRKLATVVCAIALAGCGGDSGLSASELESESAAICLDARQTIAKIELPSDLTDPKQAETFLSALLEVGDEQLSKLKALDPAAELQDDYDAYLTTVTESRDFFAGVLDKARANDPSGLADLQSELQSGSLTLANRAAAGEAGLTTCASDATTPPA